MQGSTIFVFDLFLRKYGKRALALWGSPHKSQQHMPRQKLIQQKHPRNNTHGTNTLLIRSKVAFHAAVKSEHKPKTPSAVISSTLKVKDHTKSKD